MSVGGAKNAVLPIMAACILNDGENTISNVPDLADVRTMMKLLETLGARCELEDGELLVDSSGIDSYKAPYDLVKTMRASVLVLGPLVARFKKAEVSLPGGCAIGERPIDQHIKGLRVLGTSVRLEDGYVSAAAERLEGTTVPFDLSTVTGTENIMLLASVCEGETVILNAACEPEVVDLANALNLMGARIEGAGTDIITITGAGSLGPLRDYSVMPDRIEAGTLMIAGALNESDLVIRGCRFEHLGALTRETAPDGNANRKRRGLHQGAGRRGDKEHRLLHAPLPRIPDRHAGPDDDTHVRSRRDERHNGEHISAEIHAHRRASEDGRGHKACREQRRGEGSAGDEGRPHNGERSPGERLARSGGALRGRQDGSVENLPS